jgi:hypothetical protein
LNAALALAVGLAGKLGNRCVSWGCAGVGAATGRVHPSARSAIARNVAAGFTRMIHHEIYAAVAAE